MSYLIEPLGPYRELAAYDERLEELRKYPQRPEVEDAIRTVLEDKANAIKMKAATENGNGRRAAAANSSEAGILSR